MPMTPDDHVALKSITDAFPQHLRLAFNNIFTMMQEDAKEGRAVFPNLDTDDETAQLTLYDRPGNRARKWMEILTSLTHATDTENVFDDHRLVGFISALIYCLHDGHNPFEGANPDEDEDEDFGLSDDDVAISPVIQTLLDQYTSTHTMRSDSDYKSALTTGSIYTTDLSLTEDAFVMVSNVLQLYHQTLTQFVKQGHTIRKAKRLRFVSLQADRAFGEQLGVLANTLYTQAALPALTALRTSIVLMAWTEFNGLDATISMLSRKVEQAV